MTKQHQRSNQFGIIGGGQLALMLADAAEKMGIRPVILAEDSATPVAQARPHCIFGSSRDAQKLKEFFSKVDRVIFENEFLDCKQLKEISSEFGVQFYPGLEIIEMVQDKLTQKQILDRLKIPTAPYEVLQADKDIKTQLRLLSGRFPKGFVLKWSRLGYDGKGVLLLKDVQAKMNEAEAFCNEALNRKIPVYAEELIPFKRELAILGVRSTKGEFLTYPLVISEQKQGICWRVFGPANQFGVSLDTERAAGKYAQVLAESVKMIGTFAVEFFETDSGSLVVNEIAPRVHNSGHYSLDASMTDQFENHWRAVLGLPLGKVSTHPGFAMLNVLGPEGIILDANDIHPRPGPQSHLHWYGKKGIRPGRKLGHLNGVVVSPSHLDNLKVELDLSYENWVKKLRQI